MTPDDTRPENRSASKRLGEARSETSSNPRITDEGKRTMIEVRNPEDCADAMRELVKAAEALNSAVAVFGEATGLSAQLYVNGYEYGDRIGVRVEGNLLDANAKPALPPATAVQEQG